VIVLVPVLFYPLFFELPAVTYLGVWALSQLFSGTLSLAAGEVGGVAWWAHAGGFLAGIVLQAFFVRRRGYRRPARDEYGIEGAWLPARHWSDSS
jgi:membrane associated rhomboid family serine protease